jgi:hypothetical protein
MFCGMCIFYAVGDVPPPPLCEFNPAFFLVKDSLGRRKLPVRGFTAIDAVLEKRPPALAPP